MTHSVKEHNLSFTDVTSEDYNVMVNDDNFSLAPNELCNIIIISIRQHPMLTKTQS